MSNSWFQFKQFMVNQDKCAMKIGTDSILLGAWTNCKNCNNVLDIGTGTGILSLIIAQRSKALVTGIEIEEDSAKQAKENIENSLWKERINIIHSSIQNYNPVEKFDLIISNPPFFQNSLNAPDKSRTHARHNITLNPEDIINAAKKMLSDNGILSLIWPVEEGEKFISLAEQSKIYCQRITYVIPNPEKPPHRTLLEFGFEKKPYLKNEITIENGKRHHYTEEYKLLTSPFYVNLK